MLFSRQHFQIHFLDWKFVQFDSNSLKFSVKGPFDSKTSLVPVTAWHLLGAGAKPLPEPMMTHNLCPSRPRQLQPVSHWILLRGEHHRPNCRRMPLGPLLPAGHCLCHRIPLPNGHLQPPHCPYQLLRLYAMSTGRVLRWSWDECSDW